MAQQLGALAALPGDLDSVPTTYLVVQPSVTLVPRDPSHLQISRHQTHMLCTKIPAGQTPITENAFFFKSTSKAHTANLLQGRYFTHLSEEPSQKQHSRHSSHATTEVGNCGSQWSA